MHQVAIFVVQPQYDGAEIFPRSFGIGVSGNHALLPPRDLDLQPLARSLLHINTRAQLGDDAFQPLVARHPEKCSASLSVVVGVTQKSFARRDHLLEKRFSPLQWRCHQVVSVEVEQIKSIIDDTDLRIARSTRPRTGHSCSLLHQAEGRTPFFIQRHHFTIEDGVLHRQRLHRLRDLRKFARQVILVARNQSRPSIIDECHRTITVPLDLIQPLRIVEWLFHQRRQHGMILLGCLPFTPLCGSFFLRCFSSWSCWVNCASLGPCRSWLRWLQGFSFGFSDQPILAAIPRPCAPCLCYPWLCDCSAIHPNLHRRRSRVSCVWSAQSNRAY